MKDNRTKRQLKMEALARVINRAVELQIALKGYDDKLANEIKNSVVAPLDKRYEKLFLAERKENEETYSG